MYLSKLRTHLSEHNWFAVFVDLMVVIVGILLAFQIQSWAREQSNRELEIEYLQRLKQDLLIEITQMDRALELADSRISAVNILENLFDKPSAEIENPRSLPWALETATWRSYPDINGYVYGELASSGNLALIRSDTLRRELTSYYTVLRQESRVGFDLATQRRFDELTTGILTASELVAVEKLSFDGDLPEITPARAVQIADALRRTDAARRLLPGLVQHHAFNKNVIGSSRETAQRLVEQIETLTLQLTD